MQWYTTVGIPGGEFALMAESPKTAYQEFNKVLAAFFFKPPSEFEVRQVSKELHDWISQTGPFSRHGDLIEAVAGGWLITSVDVTGNRTAHCFCPVEGAAGLEVLPNS